MGAPNFGGGVGKAYVIYGSKGSWSSSIPLSSLNGVNGFSIITDLVGASLGIPSAQPEISTMMGSLISSSELHKYPQTLVKPLLSLDSKLLLQLHKLPQQLRQLLPLLQLVQALLQLQQQLLLKLPLFQLLVQALPQLQQQQQQQQLQLLLLKWPLFHRQLLPLPLLQLVQALALARL